MAETHVHADRCPFTSDENRRFARPNFTKLVHTNACFERVNTTLLIET